MNHRHSIAPMVPTVETMDTAQDYAERIESEAPAAPVAVHIVAAAPIPVTDSPRREITTGQVHPTPGGQPQQIIGANAFRARLLLSTTATGGVFLGQASETLTAGSGYWLGPSSREVITSRHGLWAIADPAAGSAVTVTFLAEHVDG